MAYLVSVIGSDGGANSGKSVSGLSSTALNSLRRQIARARHERQFGIDLPDQLERRAALFAGAQQIQRDVGIAAQAVARNAVDDALRHQLGDNVHPRRQQIGTGMGIVGGNIVLLRAGTCSHRPARKKNSITLNVGRQRTCVQRFGIGEIGIAAEQTVDHGRDEAPLQQICRLVAFPASTR